ncbi:hypothetical protein [Acaryochloris sp. 'Moss Beach']|uniref:hypothetical protein n=1 Tax=Acaryochloris sp. 'Moss Beach' TaxID=2740837 RepID=UPI001F47C2C8|nr:hypothetical protein [Acaryochloris sp. 'Moss Beach']
MMPHKKRLLIITILSLQSAVALAPAFAQDSPGYTPDIISVDDVYTPLPQLYPGHYQRR